MATENVDSTIKTLSHLSKGDKTKLHIVLAARSVLARDGLDGLTFQSLARECGVTRQLVRSYFEKKNLIVAELAKIVREDYQRGVVGLLDVTQKPIDIFKSYVRLAIVWPLEHQADLSAWLAYLHLTLGQAEFKEQNGFYADAGTARIVAMLKLCKPRTRSTEAELTRRAKMIQSIILGTIVTVSTERVLSQDGLESRIAPAVEVCIDVALRVGR